jgi:hypothetical protein
MITFMIQSYIENNTEIYNTSILVSRFTKRVVVNPAGVNPDYVRQVFVIGFNNVLTLSPVILIVVKPR